MTLSIEVDRLRLRYGRVTALDDMTFSLDEGKIYGLLGRNGSGKTSLLSVVSGFRKATDGAVRVHGQPVFEHPRTTRTVCLIRDSVDLGDKGYRVGEALAYARHLRYGWDAEYAAELVDRFHVPLRTKLGQLSRGQRSALGVAVGLASRAPVTLFDESHLGMDAPTRYAFYDELLADVMAHPRTVVISTHLIEEVGPLFEEVLIIDQGRLLLHDQTDALRSRGVAVTGPADEVDRFVAGRTVLGEKQLGRTKAAMVYGTLDDAHRRQARHAGLDLGPVALQDLVVHLTSQPGGIR